MNAKTIGEKETVKGKENASIAKPSFVCFVLMNITPDLPFLNIHNMFTNEWISYI